MHIKRLVIGSILFLSIAFCMGHDSSEQVEEVIEIDEFVVGGGGGERIFEEEVLITETSGGGSSEERGHHTIMLEETVTPTKTVTVDVKEEKVIDQQFEEVFIEETQEVIVEQDFVVNEEDVSVFRGKKIEKDKKQSRESREFFEDDGILVRKSNIDWSGEDIELFGGENDDETKEVSSEEDEDNFGDGTLGQLLDELLLDPLDGLIELIKQTLRSLIVNLDMILVEVFELLAKLINVVLVIVISLPLTILDLLADIIPGEFGIVFTEYDTHLEECVEHIHMDPVNKTLVELEQCITDPLFNIVEDVIVILTDVQEILGEIDRGLRELEVVRKAEDALTQVVAIVLDVVEGVLEIVSDLVAGPVADLLVLLPVLLACIVGDIGKNLIGGLLSLLKEYIDCYTFV